jgi:hypothetical protein
MRSFTAAMAHKPKEWVVVIPAKLLPAMRAYILGLSSEVKITIRDREWLDNRLIDDPDLAEYFQYRTDIDCLHARAEALKVNPLFRSPAEVGDKIAVLQRAIDASDPDWTFDLATVDGQIVQTLRAEGSQRRLTVSRRDHLQCGCPGRQHRTPSTRSQLGLRRRRAHSAVGLDGQGFQGHRARSRRWNCCLIPTTPVRGRTQT